MVCAHGTTAREVLASPVTATRIAPRVCEYPFLDNSLLRELEGVVYRRETVSRRLGTARVRGERDGDG